ncbi:GPO family capsid scaffolding protein [Massilia sp. YIM B02763]|uniref:GPO family capsid scaffolding protein n=1 Tax=Massilia sp. YIM B02763 TaxID=3050130 RepID=UPI0025B6EDBE|nr:GPO family capsid scaffolding protein [Massilia sp. YIM B02763]MDN4056325.1 GPO family capsid scaffolding protein [Massilia sp. YIM B02763]
MFRKRHLSLALAAAGLMAFVFDAQAAGAAAPGAGAAVAGGLGLLGLSAATTGTENHADKTKFFRIAKEGATTDGRTIEREWLVEMAANYDPVNVYGARINLEHFRGVIPDSPFKAYGDVLALETREEADGKLGLYAQIKPTPDLVAMTKAGQKVYTSCEINPKFADTGEAYLVGLAVTDNPASLGTEMLAFAAQHPNSNPLAKKKQDPANLFSAAAEELVIEMESKSIASVLLSKVQALLGKNKEQGKANDERFADVHAAVETIATHSQESSAALSAQIQALTDTVASLTAKLSTTDDGTPTRPLQTGGAGTSADEKTDC